MKNKKLFLVCFCCLLLDIISKALVVNMLKLKESIVIINNFFNLTYVRNTGVAFSLFDDNLFVVVIITLFFVYYLIREIYKNSFSCWNQIFYGMILGGALGNLINRVISGYVIDFFDFNLFGYDYPVFNVADCFIVIGVVGVIILELKKESSGKNEVSSR